MTVRGVADLDAERVARGLCRHCAGPVPCHSSSGDSDVGRHHTYATYAALMRGLAKNKKAGVAAPAGKGDHQ